MRPHFDPGFLAGLVFASLVAFFLVGPVILSVLAGVTANYQRGILESGITLAWLGRVFELYAPTIALSLGIALATLVATLLLGVPVAYALALIAAGRAEAAWDRATKAEWDVAAGAALVVAAGGHVTTWDGAPLVFNRWPPRIPGLVATGPHLLEAVRRELAPRT